MRNQKGQSLIEIFVALGISVLMIGGMAGAFSVIFRANDFAEKSRNAVILNDGLAELARSFADGNWPGLYNLSHGSGNRYYLINSGGTIAAQSGTEALTIGSFDYARSFYADNVSRDGGGNIEAVYNPVNDDSSTQKITVETNYSISGASRTSSAWFYVTRMRNFVLDQTDWSGGAGQAGPIDALNNRFSSSASVDFTTTPGSIFPTLAICNAAAESCTVISSIFDTGAVAGVGFDTFMWQGNQPGGTKVQFRIAASNCANGANNPPVCNSGSWSYSSPAMAPAGPDIQVPAPQSAINNMRYFQYKIIFDTAGAIPRVDDVLISLSR